MSDQHIDDETRFRLVKLIEQNPLISQRELASELGVSLGKVNYCVRALVRVGWIKVGKFKNSSSKLGYMYVITPQGFREKVQATLQFLQKKQAQYERLSKEIIDLQLEVKRLKGQESHRETPESGENA